MSLGPRPMYSCSKRVIPSQMPASISPSVFMVISSVSDFPAGSQTLRRHSMVIPLQLRF